MVNAVAVAKDAVLAVAAAAGIVGFYLYYTGYIHLRIFYELMGIDLDAIDVGPYEILAYSSFPIRTRWPQWVFDLALLALVLYAIRRLRQAKNVWGVFRWAKRGAEQQYSYAAVLVFAAFSAFIVLRAMAVQSANADANSWKAGDAGTPVVFDILVQKRCNYSPDFLTMNGYARAVTAACEEQTKDRAASNLAYKRAGRLLYFGENRTSYFVFNKPIKPPKKGGTWIMYRIAKTDVATPRVVLDPPSPDAAARAPRWLREKFDGFVTTLWNCIVQNG